MLATPSKMPSLQSHHKLSSTSKDLISTWSECGVGPSKIDQVLNASGKKHVTPQDCIDHLRTGRKNNMGHECMSIVKTFLEKKSVNNGFFFQYELDESYTARSIFWADGKSRANYMNFGDVVMFDVTYRTNNFSMPFAPFTGVNHHRQSTLFGCVLLVDETEETFVSLFSTWLYCMCPYDHP